MVDRRLEQHWRRQHTARAGLRRSLPSSWRTDPRPRMEEVREAYVEAMLKLRADPGVRT